MKYSFARVRHEFQTKKLYLYFIIPLILSILTAFYFSPILDSFSERKDVQSTKTVEFNQSSMKLIKKQYSSITYNTTGPIFDYFYLSCGPDIGIYNFDTTSNCLVLRYDKKPGSVQFRISKDLLRQEGGFLSSILYPRISNVEAGLFIHKSIPFQVVSEDDQYVDLRVDVPINEPVIYVNFAEKCTFMCGSSGLVFFVTFIVYYPLFWIVNKEVISNLKKGIS